jgi:SAGA-associated factor 29
MVSAATNGRGGVSITLPARNSVGPSPQIPYSREPKARREALAKQLPLQEGRKVAFHQHNGNGKGNGDGEGDNWILAVVLKSINADRNR